MTPVQSVQPARLNLIQNALLTWFKVNARNLPWRQTRDPYRILVSEVMLQQTQVDRVIPYYRRFLARFPTVNELAAAATGDVIRLWSGLGYNRRAVNLQRAAMVVAEQFQGLFPSDPDQLRKLPGVGSYTAGALAAFAFERDVVFLDTNMRRVVSRLVFGTEPVNERQVLDAARQLLPQGKGWEWNQALIEFGALQCTARLPACVVCPLQSNCAAYPTIQTALAVRKLAGDRLKATPFESTTRYYRGKIVDVLRSLPQDSATGIDFDQLGSRVRPGFSQDDLPWLRGLVEGLQRDGLAVIAEDSPRYDGDATFGGEPPRVRLP
jgi:A/G-specific adenine glycosylase